jgi:hypothetical protein
LYSGWIDAFMIGYSTKWGGGPKGRGSLLANRVLLKHGNGLSRSLSRTTLRSAPAVSPNGHNNPQKLWITLWTLPTRTARNTRQIAYLLRWLKNDQQICPFFVNHLR